MKKKELTKKNVKNIFSLLVFLMCLFPVFLKAQKPFNYVSEPNGVTIGTLDTRLAVSIYETDTSVIMKVIGVGLMDVGTITFPIFYNPNILKYCYPDFEEVTKFGLLTNKAAVYNEEFLDKSWINSELHRNFGQNSVLATLSGHTIMRAIVYDLSSPSLSRDNDFMIDAGEVKIILEATFKKVTTGKDLVHQDFGIGVKTTGAGTGYYFPLFGNDGYSVWYRDLQNFSIDDKDVNKDLFLFRSGFSVKTEEAENLATISATLKGYFEQGAQHLQDANNILDTIGSSLTGTGKLRHDTIVDYGFIYSMSNVTITIDEFSKIMKIDNVDYPAPTSTEITAGEFIRGGHTFYITELVENDLNDDFKYYEKTITGLIPLQQYYAWAFTHYYFETSDIFPAVGSRIAFKTNDCIALNIGTVFTVEEPYCNNDNGKIQMFVTGGSGNYVFSVNGSAFQAYTDDIIDNLTAGIYTIAVKDINQLSCDSTVVENIVLHSAETDLSVMLTANNAPTCNGYGSLFVTVTGGQPGYTYLLNGVTPTIVNGWITSPLLTVGEYELTVTDGNGCVATSGIVNIYSDDSQLNVTAVITQQADCITNSGAIEFTVTGANNDSFTYQLDGYQAQLVENYDGSLILLSGLSAGIHYLTITDACNQVIETITITNGNSNAFAFTATSQNEMLDCNNDLTPGSITLTLTNGTPNFEYRINNGTWQPLTVVSGKATLNNLNHGFYRIEVRDAFECTYEVNNVTIGRDIYTPINVGTIYAVTEPTCGNNDGKIYIHATGGSGSYLYSIDGTNYTSNNIIENLYAGTYNIYVKDAQFNTCSEVVIDNVVLHSNKSDLSVSVLASNSETCNSNGTGTGILTINVTGGTGNYSYTLNGTDVTANIINGMITGLSAGVYVLEVKDGEGCIASSGEVRINLTTPTLMVTELTKVDASCGSSTGVYSFKVNGNNEFSYQLNGNPKVDIQYTGADTTIILTGLSAGTHYLTVTDDCNEVSKEFEITNGTDGLAFEAMPTNEIVNCDGNVMEGYITLTVTNGSGNYEYRYNQSAWTSFSGSSVIIDNLLSGIFSIEVRDDLGCTYEVNHITIGRDIITPITIGTVFAAKEPSCGNNNGEIQVFASGGSGSYLYSTNGVDFAPYTNGLITGLTAGTYTIWVKDANNNTCNEAVIGNIVLHSMATDLSVNVVAENAPTCNTDGKLFISATGGSGSYTFYLNTINSTPLTLTNGYITRPTGAYVIYVKDTNGCVASSEEVRINANSSDLDVTINVTANAMCGSNNGIANVIVSGLNSLTYTYQLDAQSEVTGQTGNSFLLTGLSAGKHYLRITDDCDEIVKEFTVNNEGSDPFAVVVTSQNETYDCANKYLPGNITLVANNGTQPYQYRINGDEWLPFTSNNQTTIDNLSSGIYLIEVKDKNECTFEVNQVTISRDIYTPINIGTIYAVVEPDCGNDDGEIQVFATGGSGSYLYSINGVDFYPYANGIITNLYAGIYTITVMDALFTDCPPATIGNVVLHNNNTDLDIVVTPTHVATCADKGSLFVTVTGGTGNYTYYVNGVLTNVVDGVIANLAVGEYEVTVHSGDCVAGSEKVRITATQSVLAVTGNVTQNTTCGVSAGEYTFTVTNSNSLPYSYQLNGNPIVKESAYTQTVLKGLSAGVHYLRVWDNCAEIIDTITITNGTNGFEFTATPQNEVLACDGDLIPGSIMITLNNGTANYQYRIDGGEWKNLTLTSSTSAIISGLHQGFYRVEVKDATECTYLVNNVTIKREIHPQITIGTVFANVEPTCGNDDGEIQVFATGGSGSYLYSIDGQNFLPYTDGIITGLSAGTYTIWVKDASDATCDAASIGNITLFNAKTDMNVSVVAEDATNCEDPTGVLHITANGGSGTYTYYLNDLNSAPIQLINGTYNVKAGVYVVYVVDSKGCMVSSGEVQVNSKTSQLTVNVTTVEDATCGSSTGIVNVSVGGSSPFAYQLNGNPVVLNQNAHTFTLTGLSAGQHVIRVWDNCGADTAYFNIYNDDVNGLSFTAVAENEILDCEGDLIPGYITLNITGGTPQYQYRIDGGAWKEFASTTQTIIENLHTGIYLVEVKDAKGCTYEVNNITIERETSQGTNIMPPVATTPQTFCENATVANLQATGVGIKWYLTAEGGEALLPTHQLDSGVIYYAAQSIGMCESQIRTAVKVYIDADAIFDAPEIQSPQYFCENAILSDIATDGNTNIVWYAQKTGGFELDITTTVLVNGNTYYAAIKVGDCESSERTAVQVFIDPMLITAPEVQDPQHFCDGAMVGNLAVPNNQIVWYAASTGGDALDLTTPLVAGFYWAAQKAGDCESATRTRVEVIIDQLEAPIAPELQGICGKETLADLTVTGSGIVWYNAAQGGIELPLSHPIQLGETYWAAQTSNDCSGERLGITMTDSCLMVYGTVFPFVWTGVENFDSNFEITVNLHKVPEIGVIADPIEEILFYSTPIHTTTAINYNGTIFVPGTPKLPGAMGQTNNPGLPIDWTQLGYTLSTPNAETLAKGETPHVPVGLFIFENVKPGEYIIEIIRDGFLVRLGKVELSDDKNYLGHREILAGDVNKDYMISSLDINKLKPGMVDSSSSLYEYIHDFNGDGHVNSTDLNILLFNLNSFLGIYQETMDWAIDY